METFVKRRDYAASEFEKRSRQQASRKPNFLCVIPGTFSLFSTLAHQAYSGMEIRGLFKGLSAGANPEGTPTEEGKLDDLVAHPHAEELVPQLERWP